MTPPVVVTEADFYSRLQACNAQCLYFGQGVATAEATAKSFTIKIVGDARSKADHYYHGGPSPAIDEICALLTFLRKRAAANGHEGFLLMNGVLVKKKVDLFRGGQHAIFTISLRTFQRRWTLHSDNELREMVLGGRIYFQDAGDKAESKRAKKSRVARAIQARKNAIEEPVRM